MLSQPGDHLTVQEHALLGQGQPRPGGQQPGRPRLVAEGDDVLAIRLAALLDRTLAMYGDDADFTAMAKIVEADAGLDPERG